MGAFHEGKDERKPLKKRQALRTKSMVRLSHGSKKMVSPVNRRGVLLQEGGDISQPRRKKDIESRLVSNQACSWEFLGRATPINYQGTVGVR